MTPKSATISYGLPNYSKRTNTVDIPDDKISIQRAWDSAARLGLNPSQMALKEIISSYNRDENNQDLTNQIHGRIAVLSRQLDGILFWNTETHTETLDGFCIEFGSHGQVRGFSLVWPDLKRLEQQPAASREQMIACIRAAKTMLSPDREDWNYSERLKALAQAKKLTITKITPYYLKGAYTDLPTEDPPPTTTPIAELEAVADLGNSNLSIRLLSPIIVPQVEQLLKPK